MEAQIEELRKALSSIDGDLFNSKQEDKYNGVVDVCKSLLLGLGYRVVAPVKYTNGKILKIDHLIALFYSYLYRNHPKNRPYRNTGRDRAVMSAFIDSRMLNGVTKQQAMNECGEIITTIFRYEREFCFKPEYELKITILGQDKCGWITEKAINIIHRERHKREELALEQRVVDVENELAYKYKDDYNLCEILNELREDKDGSKKETNQTN